MARRKVPTAPADLPIAPPDPLPPVELVPTWEWEERMRREGWESIAGVDEAGRGPLAGPVVAAAVVLPSGWECSELRDSKCLLPPVRETLFERIAAEALAWAAVEVSVEVIDRINILRATHLAMARALDELPYLPHGALVDGLAVKGLPCGHRAIVDGDALCMSIAAASVVAKVTRDRRMVELAAVYPGYGFDRHKGYSTPEHRRLLRELGPCPCHRRSFQPVRELCEPPQPTLFPEETTADAAPRKKLAGRKARRTG